MKLRYTFDKEADAVYIYLSNKPYAYGIDLDNERRVDYAADNTPIGIELLYVSKGVNPEDLPQQAEVAKILQKEHIRAFA